MKPKLKYARVALLPPLVRAVCYNNDAWVVGSGALYLTGGAPPRDWDLVVPLDQWCAACKVIPKGSVTNSHGGARIVTDWMTVDVWCGDVARFLCQSPEPAPCAVSPKLNAVLFAARGNDRTDKYAPESGADRSEKSRKRLPKPRHQKNAERG